MKQYLRKYIRYEALLWLIMGIGICFVSLQLRIGTFQRPGAGFMPFLLGIYLGVLGLIMIFSSESIKRNGNEDAKIIKKRKTIKEWKPFILTLVALLGNILLLNTMGFLITSFLFLFFLLKIGNARKWMEPFILAVVAVSFSYLIFVLWLQSQFPKGILGI